MHIGILGPLSLQSVVDLLSSDAPTTDGLGSYPVAALVGELHTRGHRISVFTLSPDERDAGRYSGERFELHVGRYRRRHRSRDLFRAEVRELSHFIDSDSPDILHAHWTYEFAFAALRSTRPSLITVRDWAPQILRHHPHPYRLVRLAMQASTIYRAQHLTANSPYIAQQIHRIYRRDARVVPNAIAVPDHLPRRDDRNPLVLGSVNNGFGKLKNVRALLPAFQMVRTRNPEAHLRLVGADFERDGPAETWARDRGLHHNVDFVGAVPPSEIPEVMRSIDVLVHPSLEESFGMVLLEAIVQGTLVVGGERSGAVPWVLGEGAAGVLTDVTNPAHLAAAITALDESRASWPSRREAAFRYVRTHFSLPAAVDSFLEEYSSILANSDRPRAS